MIYTDIQLKEKITQMIENFESEVVEFKEAKSNYSFKSLLSLGIRGNCNQVAI